MLFDAREWHATALRKIREPSFVKTVESAEGTLIFRSFTRLDPESRKLLVRECHTLEKEGAKTAREYDFVMRCWTSEELRTGLVRAGFGSIAFFGDYNRDKPLGSTDRIVVAASLH